MNHFIGTSGFQYLEWKGNFYPKEMSAARMLTFYAEHFSTTEINYSFRRIPSGKTIDRWIQETPDHFHFSLKAPQKITHFSKLRDCGETVRYFHEVTLGLGEKRGAVLFQLPPSLEKDVPLLEDFLASFPSDMKAAFEFRHPSWFDENVYNSLNKKGSALCLAESADLVTPRVVTADFGYLRLRREDYAKADLLDWAKFLEKQRSVWSDAYIYFKHEAAGVGPRFADNLIAVLGSDH